MYKNVQANPKKSQKLTQHSCCSMLTQQSQKFEIKKRQRISFHPERWNVPYRNHHTCCEELWFVKSSRLWEAYTQTCPKWDKICTTACWGRSMIACQVSWISDEFWMTRILIPGISLFYRQSTMPWCLKFIPISCMGPKHATEDTYLIFQPVYMHWSMCI